MSNRKLALLVLFWAFSAIGYAFYFFFVRNVSEVRVAVRGPETATVSLMKGNTKMLSVECAGDCVLSKVPPFDYALRVDAKGYKSHEEPVSVRTTDKIYRVVQLERDVGTTAYVEDRKDKVAELRSKRAILGEEGVEEKEREYYGQYRGFDYYSDRKPNFRLVERSPEGTDKELFSSEAGIEPNVVLWEGGVIWLEAQGASSLFDLESGFRDYPSLPSWITKVDKGLKTGTYVITDKNAAYSYDRVNKALEKVSLYDDYVPMADGKIVALVKKWNETKASLLNLGDSSSAYVFTDRSAGDRKVIYSTGKDISNLHAYGTGSVVLEFADGSKEVLTNFE